MVIVTSIFCVCDLLILGSRMFHTATRLSNEDVFIYGGRTSPSKPCKEAISLSLTTSIVSQATSSHTKDDSSSRSETDYEGSKCLANAVISEKSYMHSVVRCHGDIPEPRWRHTASCVVLPDGRYSCFLSSEFCFVICSW